MTAEAILFSHRLEDKFLPPVWEKPQKYSLQSPGRPQHLQITSKRVKFPKAQHFDRSSIRGKALHFFANHELLAIETMAWALVTFEEGPWKQSVAHALQDEQKHLKLYLQRMEELGVAFGDYPLNGFFWQVLTSSKSPAQFFALMALTFEAANLDFCEYYRKLFEEVGDHKSAQVMETIFQDELKHVSFGVQWLKRWMPGGELWDYYCSLLPQSITPDRAKGIVFCPAARQKASMPESFIQSLSRHRGQFPITQRKSWK